MILKVLILLSLVACPVRLVAQLELKPFSSDVTYTVNGETFRGTSYSDGYSVRIEPEGNVSGQLGIRFVRLETGNAQTSIPALAAYSEYPYGSLSDGEFVPYLKSARVKVETLGTETVNGEQCEKVLVKADYNHRIYSSFEWRAHRLQGFVVKNQDAEGQWSTEYSHVLLGLPTSSVFQIPATYQRVSFSQDWSLLTKRIQFAEEMAERMSIAKKAGLNVVGDRGLPITEGSPPPFVVQFIDPVTGSNIFDATTNVDSFVPGLAAPSLTSPESGVVFSRARTEVVFRWAPVQGAVGYIVEVVVLPEGEKETSYSDTSKGLTFIRQSTTNATYSVELARAGVGRWRVSAIDTHGTRGATSMWSTFEFAR